MPRRYYATEHPPQSTAHCISIFRQISIRWSACSSYTKIHKQEKTQSIRPRPTAGCHSRCNPCFFAHFVAAGTQIAPRSAAFHFFQKTKPLSPLPRQLRVCVGQTPVMSDRGAGRLYTAVLKWRGEPAEPGQSAPARSYVGPTADSRPSRLERRRLGRRRLGWRRL